MPNEMHGIKFLVLQESVDIKQIDTRFAATFFTYCDNGGKLPATKGKPSNYHLPIGKNSVHWLVFLKVKLNFQCSGLDAPVTHGNLKTQNLPK